MLLSKHVSVTCVARLRPVSAAPVEKFLPTLSGSGMDIATDAGCVRRRHTTQVTVICTCNVVITADSGLCTLNHF